MRQRPTGIAILALIFMGLGILSFLWSLFVFGFGGITTTVGALFGASGWSSSGVSNVVGGVIGMTTAIVQFIVAFGLWRLRPWAWILALIAVGLSVVNGVMGMFGGGFFTFCCGAFGLLIPLGLLIYLFSLGVRRAFGR